MPTNTELNKLKKRFKILNPQSLPHWVCIEALAMAEFSLSAWLYRDNNNELQWHSLMLDETAINRIQQLTLGSNSLFKEQDMRYSWEKVRGLYKGNPIKSQAWFAICLMRAFLNPYEILQPKTEAEKQKEVLLAHLEKALSLSLKLATNISEEWRHNLGDNEKRAKNRSYACYPPPHARIFELITALKESQFRLGELPKNVNAKAAPRLYFIRSLTMSFIHKTGKPYRKVVANAASAAFDCSIAETEVSRATKDLELRPYHDLVHWQTEETLSDLKICDLLIDPFSK